MGEKIKMKPAHIYYISFGGTSLIVRYKGESTCGCQHDFYSHLHYWNGYERYYGGGYCVHSGIEEIREATDAEKHTLIRFEIGEKTL